jgi:hypothetical protein
MTHPACIPRHSCNMIAFAFPPLYIASRHDAPPNPPLSSRTTLHRCDLTKKQRRELYLDPPSSTGRHPYTGGQARLFQAA